MSQERADTGGSSNIPDPPGAVSNQNAEEAEGAHEDPKQNVLDRKRREREDAADRGRNES